MKKKDLQVLWSQLTQGVEADDADIPDSQIADALQKNAHPVFQIVYDRGHGAATETGNTRVKELETQLATLRQERDTAQQQLADERKKQPDTEEIRRQYEEREQQLKDDFEKRETALKEKFQKQREDTTREKLRGLLVAAGDRRLDSDYADVLIQKSEVSDRIRYPDDGGVEVLQAGKQIALAPADGVSPLELLANELKEAAPPKFVNVNGDAGAGSRGDSTAASGSGSSFWNGYRKELETERSPTSNSDMSEEAASRLGVRTR